MRRGRTTVVHVGKRRIKLDPTRVIGSGGEADIYAIDGDKNTTLALKIFKGPKHPDFQGIPGAGEGARRRIEQHQRKLRAFPAGLPARVVTPLQLATTKGGRRVLGYTMPLIDGAEPLVRLADPGIRRREGFARGQMAIGVLRQLHALVAGIHAAGAVIGDFNDLNVLVTPDGADPANPMTRGVYVIDADSFQLPGFPCLLFTERFLDPLRCDGDAFVPARRATPESDWYAFAVMAMQSLLCVGPYGGIHRPKARGKRLSPTRRALKRVTVFHPDVRYPRPAIPPELLPDALLHMFTQWFVEDRRGVFPAALLDGLRWTRCSACGVEHARAVCPKCTNGQVPARAATPTVSAAVGGTVDAERLFGPSERPILYAGVVAGAPCWLVYEDGALRREGGSVVLRGRLPRAAGAAMKIRLTPDATLIGLGGQLVIASQDGARERVAVDLTPDGQPAFDVNAAGELQWAHGGLLHRMGPVGPERVGEVLQGQTRLWVGPRFGFGFYRAGELRVAFIQAVGRAGLRDGVAVPAEALAGQIIATDCLFTQGHAWLLTAVSRGGVITHHCVVLREDGTLAAHATATPGDGSWLGAIGGQCSAGALVFAPTDDGVVRVELSEGRVAQTRSFPATAPYVDAATRLLVTRRGLCAVDSHSVTLLRQK